MTKNITYKEEISQTIEFLRFPATILIVLLHAYTTLQMTTAMKMEFYTTFSSTLSLSFGEIGVPLFFTISGYLFFLGFGRESYFRKIKTRTQSLLIPYILWNSIFIALYFIIQQIPSLSPLFSGNNKKVADFSLTDFLRAYWDCGNWNEGNGTPILQTYWYIRNLFLLCLASPAIYACVKRLNIFFVSIFLILWIMKKDSAFTFSSIAFFSLGSLASINSEKIWTLIKNNLSVLSIVYVSILTIDIILKINLIYPYGYYVHRIGLIIAIPFLFSWCNRLCKAISIPQTFTKASFFIYTLHLPIMLAVRKTSYHLIPDDYEILHIILYLASVPIVTTVCYYSYLFLSTYTPKILKILNGR